MDSEEEQFIYCELCGYVTLDNLCDHITLEDTSVSEEIQETSREVLEERDISGDTLEELLISLVEDRRPLWDTRIPITQRNKVIREKLWLEIYESLQGQYSIEFLQKKWKNLRDTFMKKKVEVDEYIPSGSAAPKKKKIWKHYDLLQFLSDTVAPRKTTTNLSEGENEDKENDNVATSSTKKKCSKSNPVEDAFIEAIQNVQPLKSYQNKEYVINPICIKISQILDVLNEEKRAQLELELMTLTYRIAYPSINKSK